MKLVDAMAKLWSFVLISVRVVCIRIYKVYRVMHIWHGIAIRRRRKKWIRCLVKELRIATWGFGREIRKVSCFFPCVFGLNWKLSLQVHVAFCYFG